MNARRPLHRPNKAHLAVEPLENRLAPAIYMKYEGIPHESMQESRRCIEVMSFRFGVSTGAEGHSSASLRDFVRGQDVATPNLFSKCCTGEHIAEAILNARRAEAPQAFMEYKFEQVYISSVRPGGGDAGSEFPLEEVSLNFGALAGGVNVASGDLNADGFDDVIVGNAVDNDDAEVVFCDNNAGGACLPVGDLNYDGRADVISFNAVDNDDAEIVCCLHPRANPLQSPMPVPGALWAKHSEDTPSLQAR